MKRLACLLLVGALITAGCARRDAPAPTACACASADAVIVDPALFAFLSKARATHHEADIAEQAGDRGRAIARLDALVRGTQPSSGGNAPEIAEVIADARARLAELRSAGGEFDAAEADVAEGLRVAPGVTHFRGHLLEVRGVVEERRAKELAKRGDHAAAARANAEAVRAFEDAIAVGDDVISRALGDAGAR